MLYIKQVGDNHFTAIELPQYFEERKIMLDSILTVCYDSALVFGILFIAIALVLHNFEPKIEPEWLDSIDLDAQMEPEWLDPIDLDAEMQADFEATFDPIVTNIPATFQRNAIDWSKFTTSDLRMECQNLGIKWRHGNGKNRHLTKSQMVIALHLQRTA